MTFTAFDLIISAGILALSVGALSWLLVAGKRADEKERERSARWLREYFHGGGLVRVLMARWNLKAGLQIDQTEMAIELPESVDRA